MSVAVLTAVFAVPQAYAAGTWGESNSPYLDGIICDDGGATSPLASWDFGAGAAPAFLLSPVRSADGVDSGQLPSASTGVQRSTAVSPGIAGFRSVADLASYAYLVNHFGRDSAAHVAEVAQAVMVNAGSAGVPGCVADAEVNSLLQTSGQLAGPYTVNVKTSAAMVAMGAPIAVSATVLSAQGIPAPGMAVTFAADAATFSNARPTTDAHGTAATTMTVAPGTAASTVEVHAAVSASIGLEEVVAYDSAGMASVGAVYPAPPVTVTGIASVTIDPTATPVVHAITSARAIPLGQSFGESASITGLRGHAAGVHFEVHGPIPLDASGACSATPGSLESAWVAATTSTVDLVGDGTVNVTPWTPPKAGCYWIQAFVSTTNANPEATTQSALDPDRTAVAVLDTSASVTPEHSVFEPGAINATAHIANSYGRGVSVGGTLVGPAKPVGNSCAAADFTKARSASPLAVASPMGDGSATVVASASSVGCYRLNPKVSLSLGALGNIELPVATSTILVLTPSVLPSIDQVWSISPDPVTAKVDVNGTQGQPAHLRIDLAYAPPTASGCLGLDWSHTRTMSQGTAIAIRGDVQNVKARSGPTTALGCYLPIAELTLDANPAIVVTAPLSDTANAISVGVDPNAPRRRTLARALRDPLLPEQLAAALAMAGLAGGVATTLLIARRSRPAT